MSEETLGGYTDVDDGSDAGGADESGASASTDSPTLGVDHAPGVTLTVEGSDTEFPLTIDDVDLTVDSEIDSVGPMLGVGADTDSDSDAGSDTDVGAGFERPSGEVVEALKQSQESGADEVYGVAVHDETADAVQTCSDTVEKFESAVSVGLETLGGYTDVDDGSDVGVADESGARERQGARREGTPDERRRPNAQVLSPEDIAGALHRVRDGVNESVLE